MRLVIGLATVIGLSGGAAFADTSAAPTGAKKLSEVAAAFTKIVVHDGLGEGEKKSEVTVADKVKAAWEALGPAQSTGGPVARCPDTLRLEFVAAETAKTVTVGFCNGLGGPARVSTGVAPKVNMLGGITVADSKKLANAIGRGEPSTPPPPRPVPPT